LDKLDTNRLLGDGLKHLKHPAYGTQAVSGGKPVRPIGHELAEAARVSPPNGIAVQDGVFFSQGLGHILDEALNVALVFLSLFMKRAASSASPAAFLHEFRPCLLIQLFLYIFHERPEVFFFETFLHLPDLALLLGLVGYRFGFLSP
jgi:hypothetical protein